MIEYLRLHNLGIINEAQVELGPGLTVLTGETGAGKTMVLTALDLLLGGKSDSGLASSDDTRVQGVWGLDADHPILAAVEEAGGRCDDGELVLTRTLPTGGRSRCAAGGSAVPASLLAEWGEQLVAVHGQSDQSLLRRESAQRAVLDRYAGPKMAAAQISYGESYSQVLALDTALAEASSGLVARQQERERLQAGLEEIEAADPQPGEDDQLAERGARLGNVEELNTAAAQALAAIAGDGESDGGITELAAAAKHSLDSAAGLDPQLEALSTRISEISVLANEAGVDLSRYIADLDASPGELEMVQSRRAELTALTRAYGPTIDDVLAWAKQAAARVFELDELSDIGALREKRDAARTELAKRAAAITKLRKAAAESFSEQVSEELRGLSMPDSRVIFEINPRQHRGAGEGLTIAGAKDPVGFGPDGVDEVALLLVSHRGAKPAPIGKSASGGELSRVMLAIEVVLAGTAVAPTFVFDEVDAGVGGKAAVEIGRRLARLGQSAQVLVVTHLPQVAAFADNHLVVRKSNDGTVTTSGVTALDPQERVRELARMLAGQDESEFAAAHAGELLDLAALERAKGTKVQ